ncbi:MAG: tetratricopeptide repeat protein [Acidobacteria bacterium]|nr:tetratricopeptide repeat protein [Acidobacteriota bacterium]
MSIRQVFAVVLLCCAACLAQNPNQAPVTKDPPQPRPTLPRVTPPPQQTAQPAQPDVSGNISPDRSAAYYHYSLAHIYEELVSLYQRPEFATKAIEEYKLALQADPSSEYLNSSLAELYAKTGRIRDAVTEAQDLIKRDPNNIEARRLLGRIYLRSLGDPSQGAQSQQMLKLAIEQYEQIVRIDPKGVDDHLLLGRLYKANNESAKAEAEFNTAIRLQPQSEEAVTTLALLYDDEGQNERAAQMLNAMPEGSRTGKTYAALGLTYEQEKDYKSAVAAYKKAVDLDHDNLDAVRGLAQNLLNSGDADAALQQYRTVAEADPQDAQTYLRIAEIYRRLGRFDPALEALAKAEAIVSDSQEIPFTRAEIYEAQGRYDDAIQILQKLIEKSTKPANEYTPGELNNLSVFYEHLGNIYKQQSKLPQAVDAYKKMESMGAENAVRGYDLEIEAYRDSKDWQAATRVAREAVQKLPENRTLKLVYAGELADVGKADEAIAEARSLLKGNQEDREVLVALAQIYDRLRRWKDAEETLAKAAPLSQKPEDRQYVQFLLADTYDREKKYDEAEQIFRRLLAEDSHNAAVLNYFGYMLGDRGVRLEEALNYVKKAVELEPQNAAYLDSLGWIYFKLGNYDQAEDNLRKASERMNNDPTIQDHLGDLYQKTGRLKQAAAHWERALDEWQHSVPGDVDQNDVTKTQKKLESARVKLAQENTTKQQ